MSIAIFALDPGKTTGWALVKIDPRTDLPKVEISGECPNWEIIRSIEGLLYDTDWNHIIYEEFIANPMKLGILRNRDSLIPLEVIGALKYASNHWSLPNPEGYPAAQRKFFTDKRLKMLGCYVEGKHARDAVRHALSYAAFQLHVLDEGLRLLADDWSIHEYAKAVDIAHKARKG